ncbi:hypothetical protein R3P38DRAFT_2541878 [Favolaschia claudopus]|uniref:Uncharacterized protein n=1 Tax=Favolaschia claudopus TaxID=2862362 RepID=A0AAW0AUG0_9AGAR
MDLLVVSPINIAVVRRTGWYMPPPSNAFILSRSSFIRSQNLLGSAEGNHSMSGPLFFSSFLSSPHRDFR